jgi:hypothetical protein
MVTAIFGIIGVVLGSFLTLLKEWLFQCRTNKKELEYLSIRVSCMLDKFIAGCTDVVHDDGSSHGQYGPDGCAKIQVETPNFDPETIKVEWKSLPAKLMYKILSFPNEVETANQIIRSTFEYAASPPDYGEGFEERQFQYAQLGIKASKLASELRKLSKLHQHEISKWDPIEFMNTEIKKIEVRRKK